jgi:uncharacterized protein YggE
MKMKLILILLSVFLLPLASANNIQPTGIDVTGKGAVLAVPDVFSVSFTVTERGKSTSKIKQLVDHKSNQLVKRALKLGIKDEAIKSSNVQMFPIYHEPAIRLNGLELREQFPDNTQGKVQLSAKERQKIERVQSIEVSRTIEMTLADISIYDKLLDSATKIGITRLTPLSMSFSNAEKLYQQALALAIANAKEKAMNLAAQSGVTLGKITYLKEHSYGAPMHLRAASFSAKESSAGFDSSAGQQQISAQIQVRWAIK